MSYDNTTVRSRFISLTTFRRSAARVSTPMWFAWSARGVYVVTHATAGKLKRIAHTDSVTVAPCSSRGRVRGRESHGVAVVVPPDGQLRVAKAIAHRYLLPATLLKVEMRRRGRGRSPVYLEIVIADGKEPAR